jgi:hypothetical protein
MADSPCVPISLGRWDPYRRTPSVSLRNGKIKFLPGPGTQGEFAVKEAAFPAGARLEYRAQKGDMYFDDDHSQLLGRTLWVIQPDGSRTFLADGFVLYISLAVAARNLRKRGIPFRAVSFYEVKDRQVVEREISIAQSGTRFTTGLILGLSNLWLGAIAGAFLHSVSQIAALGAFAFAVLAIITLRSAASKRVASLTIASTLITYAASYLVAVVLVRSMLIGFTGG